MPFRLGFAPITWNNEGLDLGPLIPYTTVLEEVAATGYAGTELGKGFPDDAGVLRTAIEARGVAIPSGWCGLQLLGSHTRETDLAYTRQRCALLAGVGARFVNLAHAGTPERSARAGRAAEPACPRLSASAWDELAGRVLQAAEIACDAGLQVAFHPHVGTWVETSAELAELLRRTPASLVKLCLDVGHALYGGIDPLAVIREHPERVVYVHLKDVDSDVLAGLLRDRADFNDGIRRRVFTEVGRGRLDVPRLLTALEAAGYDGWLMVEQDSSWLAPAESARTSRAYLASLGIH